jgi:hypothetical protein
VFLKSAENRRRGAVIPTKVGTRLQAAPLFPVFSVATPNFKSRLTKRQVKEKFPENFCPWGMK